MGPPRTSCRPGDITAYGTCEVQGEAINMLIASQYELSEKELYNYA